MAAAAAITLTGDDQKTILTALTEMKGLYAQLDSQVKSLGKADSDTLEKLQKVNEDVALIQAKHGVEQQKKIESLETRVADLTKNYVEPIKDFGTRICEEKSFLAYLESGAKSGFHMTIKAGTALRRSLFAKNITGLGTMLPQAAPQISIGPRLATGVRVLFPQGATTAGAVSYLRESSFTNLAAPVAEGQPKPKSDKVFAPVTAPVETIAHYFKASRQSWEDVAGLSAVIENNGIYGVALAEDDQLINGTGVSPQLHGILLNAVTGPAAGTGETLIDSIGLAVFDLAAKGYVPDGAIINPADYGAVAMMKNLQGNYLFANPIDYSGVTRAWGVRLVMSSKMAVGTGVVGAFQGNSLILDREEVNVQVAAQNEDDFIKNMLTILIEERLVLLVSNATAFEKIVVPPATVAAFGQQGGGEKPRR